MGRLKVAMPKKKKKRVSTSLISNALFWLDSFYMEMWDYVMIGNIEIIPRILCEKRRGHSTCIETVQEVLSILKQPNHADWVSNTEWYSVSPLFIRLKYSYLLFAHVKWRLVGVWRPNQMAVRPTLHITQLTNSLSYTAREMPGSHACNMQTNESACKYHMQMQRREFVTCNPDIDIQMFFALNAS